MTADDLWPNLYWYLYNQSRPEVHDFWDNVEFYDSETMALSRARNRPRRRKS